MATNERGQYGDKVVMPPTPQAHAPQSLTWPTLTPSEKQAIQRSFAMSAIGSVAGAVLWDSHRIWGFILGGMAGGAVGNLIFSPPA